MVTSHSVSGIHHHPHYQEGGKYSPRRHHKTNLMSQSLGPEQLRMNIGNDDGPPRPTKLFSTSSDTLLNEGM